MLKVSGPWATLTAHSPATSRGPQCPQEAVGQLVALAQGCHPVLGFLVLRVRSWPVVRYPSPCLVLRVSVCHGVAEEEEGDPGREDGKVLCKLEVHKDTWPLAPVPTSPWPQTFRIFSSCFCVSTTMMLARLSWAMCWQASGELVV